MVIIIIIIRTVCVSVLVGDLDDSLSWWVVILRHALQTRISRGTGKAFLG